jgi:hypothetical protein
MWILRGGRRSEVDSPAGFAVWLARLTARSDSVKTNDVGKYRYTYRWIVSDRVLAEIALRHGSGDYVRWAGHIGYGIRPSARRRGLATCALGQTLDGARVLGLDRARRSRLACRSSVGSGACASASQAAPRSRHGPRRQRTAPPAENVTPRPLYAARWQPDGAFICPCARRRAGAVSGEQFHGKLHLPVVTGWAASR